MRITSLTVPIDYQISLNNIEDLNNLKLIEDVQHDYKIKKKNKAEDKIAINDNKQIQEFTNLNVDLLRSQIKIEIKLLIQVTYIITSLG